MIAFVLGLVVDQEEDSLVLDNRGIGYRIYCGRPYDLKMGEEVLLYTHHHIREDLSQLFGFLSKTELNLFKQLISVKGVGPKTGLNILSKTTHKDFIEAIDREDVAFLRTLPGVGPRMASQLLLDLKGKLGHSLGFEQSIPNSLLEDVFSAMRNLGFKQSELNALKEPLLQYQDQSLEGLIAYGLRLINSGKETAV